MLARSVLPLVVVAAACGDNDATGTAARLKDRTFLSSSVTERGDPRPLVSGTRIRLTFSNGRITASAGCNTMSGTVRIEDDRLVISDLGSTEMGCDAARHSQDEWLASLLTASPSYVLDDTRLQLRITDTVIDLLDREVADPDRPLQQTVWAVDGIIDGSAASSIPAGTSATIVFGDDAVNLSIASCNEGTGDVKITPATIDVGRLVMTDVACSGPPAQLEAAIVRVLDGKIDYVIEAASLRLTGSNGKGLTLRAP